MIQIFYLQQKVQSGSFNTLLRRLKCSQKLQACSSPVFSTVHPVAHAEHWELFLMPPSCFLPKSPKYEWSPGPDASPPVSLASAPFSHFCLGCCNHNYNKLLLASFPTSSHVSQNPHSIQLLNRASNIHSLILPLYITRSWWESCLSFSLC